jgi:hypothetical protein
VLTDFEAVINHHAGAAERQQAWAGLGVPGPYSNGYARRQAGMRWSSP